MNQEHDWKITGLRDRSTDTCLLWNNKYCVKCIWQRVRNVLNWVCFYVAAFLLWLIALVGLFYNLYYLSKSLDISKDLVCQLGDAYSSKIYARSLVQNGTFVYSLSGRFTALSCEVPRPRDWGLIVSNRSEIWQMTIKFKSDTVIITSNVEAMGLHEIWW